MTKIEVQALKVYQGRRSECLRKINRFTVFWVPKSIHILTITLTSSKLKLKVRLEALKLSKLEESKRGYKKSAPE